MPRSGKSSFTVTIIWKSSFAKWLITAMEWLSRTRSKSGTSWRRCVGTLKVSKCRYFHASRLSLSRPSNQPCSMKSLVKSSRRCSWWVSVSLPTCIMVCRCLRSGRPRLSLSPPRQSSKTKLLKVMSRRRCWMSSERRQGRQRSK